MADKHRRTWAKVVTWRLLMLVTNTLIGWGITGSITAGAAIGFSTLVVNSIAYVAHERAWNRYTWGQK